MGLLQNNCRECGSYLSGYIHTYISTPLLLLPGVHVCTVKPVCSDHSRDQVIVVFVDRYSIISLHSLDMGILVAMDTPLPTHQTLTSWQRRDFVSLTSTYPVQSAVRQGEVYEMIAYCTYSIHEMLTYNYERIACTHKMVVYIHEMIAYKHEMIAYIHKMIVYIHTVKPVYSDHSRIK